MTDASLCDAVRRKAEGGLLGGEAPLEPREVEHLAACASCRVEAAAHDPAVVFAVLARESKPEEFWTGFETRVLAEIRAAEREKSAPRGILASLLRPRAIGLALGAAAIAAAVLLVRVGPHPGGVDEPRRAGDVVDASEGDGAPASDPGRGPAGIRPSWGSPSPVGPVATQASDAPRMAASHAPPPSSADAASPAPVEAVSSPTARVLSMNVTEQSDVVVIVDQGIDI